MSNLQKICVGLTTVLYVAHFGMIINYEYKKFKMIRNLKKNETN